MHRRWILVSSLVLAVSAFCILAYFYIRHPVPWSPKQHHRLEVWANVGSTFTVFATLFSSLGFVALIWTIWVQIDQLKTIDEGQRDAAKQAHYFSLSQRVGEVISDPEINRLAASFRYYRQLDHVVPAGQSLPKDPESLVRNLSQQLAAQKPLHLQIPVHDGFRRRKLFRAIEKLLDSCSAFQRELFKDSLNAQIHDEAARMLILKSLAESDERTLAIFGKLGIQFSVLNEVPEVAERLTSAFPERRSGK
jgi:hypothetical protein